MEIVKRNGSKVSYDRQKIVDAIMGAMEDTGNIDNELSQHIALNIELKLKEPTWIVGDITVEMIQDMVEIELMKSDRKDVAKKYILYRDYKNKERNKPHVSKYKYLDYDFLAKYKLKDDPFPEELGKIVYTRTYARPIPEENRRERWWETVARVVDYSTDLEVIARKKAGNFNQDILRKLKLKAEDMYDYMFNLKIFPSGRSLWVGGTKSSYEYPLSNFNCSYLTIDKLTKFSEMFFVLMLGTGVGLSVEKQYIEQLPKINTKTRIIHQAYNPVDKKDRLEHTELRQVAPSIMQITVSDSKYGWSRAMELYLDIISKPQYKDIEFITINYDNVRPEGEPLKTFGGFASGHNALQSMFRKIDSIFNNKYKNDKTQWQNILPIDALDIATIIAENVVSGGVRRSALIIFTDRDEEDVLNAKKDLYKQVDGEWVSNNQILHRSLSNNTIIYNEKPSFETISKHFDLMRFSGEPAFANMEAMKKRRIDVQGGNPLTI